MTTFHLGLSVSVVGPRAKLLSQELWPMAMRLTVGTPDVHSNEEAKDLISRMLPWNIWTTPEVDVVVVDRDLKVISDECDTEPALAEEASFLAALKRSIQANGESLAGSGLLDFNYDPNSNTEVEDGDDHTRKVSWPGLLQTASSLASPTPSALLCTWYFWLKRSLVAEEIGGKWVPKEKVFLSAAPREFLGAPRDQFRSQTGPSGYPVHVHDYTANGASGFCEALDVNGVLDHRLDEMDNFWLTIRDSGDDSLLQLGPQLEQALVPSAVLGSLSMTELTAATKVDTNSRERPATQGEMAEALRFWKSQAETPDFDDLRRRKAAILFAASTADEDQAGAARRAYAGEIEKLLGVFSAWPTEDGALRLFEFKRLAAHVESRLLPTPGSTLKPVSPAEGIDLLIGDESLRLLHSGRSKRSAVDDVAQIQVFGRRSSDRGMLDVKPDKGGAPWHALTSARYTVASGKGVPIPAKPRVLGVTATYTDDILCREIPYFGANMVCDHPLAGVHRESMADDPLQSFMLARIGRVAETEGNLRSLPLRYGDYYEFAAGVIDRAGGMAEELTSGAPWAFDAKRLETLQPPQRNSVRYLRAVPVGDLNVMPGPDAQWLQTPAGVSLRCMEQGAANSKGPAPAPLFLVPGGEEFQRPLNGVRPPSRFRFFVGAPQADEHTLLRWLMPDTTLDDRKRESEAKALQDRLVRIFETRDKLLSQSAPATLSNPKLGAEPPKLLDDDPAVAAVGVRWEFDDGSSNTLVVPVHQLPMVIEVGTGAADPHQPAATKSLVLKPGQFVRIGLCALVEQADLDRFDPFMLDEHLLAVQPWAGYGAFDESVVWAEAATSELPEARFDALHLEEGQPGDVYVGYSLHTLPPEERSLHRHVVQTRIASERWCWRNLPLPPEKGYQGSAEEWRRRVASGPPLALVDARHRDDDKAVEAFDRLSALDAGFVQRADRLPSYPRDTKERALLLVDERERHSQAEYLRYAVAFRSRYAPVLSKPESDWSAKRRIAVGFRGDRGRIKPPRVLAVLPLTQSLRESPVASNPAGGTPFIVVLDESWFREYGIGERLEARIARVKPEIPEGEADMPTRLRFGPLPDHHLSPITPAALGEPLTCFGPFGMTMDRGSSQALANATTFVVYPPAGTPPHYNLFVEFSRVLDLPSGPTASLSRSQPSEAFPLYTLADSSALDFSDHGKPVRLAKIAKGFEVPGGTQLKPFAAASGEVLQQYRYLMIVGQHVRDGGRGVDVFLPENALWIAAKTATTAHSLWIGEEPSNRTFTAAVVVELLLNGRFPQANHHPLSECRTLRDLLLKLLADPDPDGDAPYVFPDDAPGMIRRVSPWFHIETPV